METAKRDVTKLEDQFNEGQENELWRARGLEKFVGWSRGMDRGLGSDLGARGARGLGGALEGLG